MHRRVITETRGDGKAVFAAASDVAPLSAASRPGFAWYRFWGFDRFPELSGGPGLGAGDTAFPPPGGLRVIQTLLPPGAGVEEEFDREGFKAEWARLMPSAGRVRQGAGGRHETESIDIGFVISGEVGLELDDGSEITLRAGDVFVQHGTRHVWRNRGSEPCLMGLVLLGARQDT
jgi:mannose-6-phosphate isomerase-like protein (cupin superfamily)